MCVRVVCGLVKHIAAHWRTQRKKNHTHTHNKRTMLAVLRARSLRRISNTNVLFTCVCCAIVRAACNDVRVALGAVPHWRSEFVFFFFFFSWLFHWCIARLINETKYRNALSIRARFRARCGMRSPCTFVVAFLIHPSTLRAIDLRFVSIDNDRSGPPDNRRAGALKRNENAAAALQIIKAGERKFANAELAARSEADEKIYNI